MKLKFLFQWRYYRYLFYQLKRQHLGDYFFIEPATAIISLAFILANLFIFFPGSIGFHFPQLDIEIYVIETLLKTLSIFIGIVFSFIVLSFNIFYRYFGRFAFLNFFKSRSIKVLFTLFVTSIVFMIYSLGYLKEIETSNHYAESLFILSITFCSVTVFSIFPTIIILLRKSQNRENIHKLIQQLNLDWVHSYHENVLWNKQASYKHYQKDPITLLTEIGTVAIKEFDQTTLDTIIHGCEEFLKSAIKEEKKTVVIEPKQLYEEFRTLISNLFQVAVKERNENALFLLVRSRYNIEEAMFKNLEKVKLTDFNNKYQGWSFCFDTQDFFSRAMQFNEDEVCRRIIDNHRDFMTEIIKEILPARNYDYDFDDRMKFIDETSMVGHAFREVDVFLSSIMNFKRFHLFQNVSNLFSTLDLVCIGSKNTPNSKHFLIQIINNYKLDCFEKFIRESDIKNLPMLFYPFQTSTSQAIREAESSIPFKSSFRALDILFSYERLNTMAINSLKADSMFLLQNLDKYKVNRSLIPLAINKFNHLRGLITENDNDYKKDIYLKLEKHLSYVQNVAIESIPKETQILELIKSNLTLFVFKDKFKKELEDKGYISNESIV